MRTPRQVSVGHWDQWSMNLQGLGELVEHLLIVIKCPELMPMPPGVYKEKKETNIASVYMCDIPSMMWVQNRNKASNIYYGLGMFGGNMKGGRDLIPLINRG